MSATLTRGACKKCRQIIEWAMLTAKDGERKRHPLNSPPSAQPTTIIAARDPDTGLVEARTVPAGTPLAGREVYATSHFATCIAADHFRTRK